MSKYPPMVNCLEAKQYIWRTYHHNHWFAGAGINTDEEECIVEIRVNRARLLEGERFTYVDEHENGVKIRLVDYDPKKHSDFLREKEKWEKGL